MGLVTGRPYGQESSSFEGALRDAYTRSGTGEAQCFNQMSSELKSSMSSSMTCT